uniref:ERVV2 protein n=1 Tax=Otus sunia TaxID=257818 RepID=A0A8C8E790_9STRI
TMGYRGGLSAIDKIGNETYDALKALQEEESELAKTALQNRTALDIMLTSQGVCTVLDTSYCVDVAQSGRISTNLNEIWKQTNRLHEIKKVSTSHGFKETFKWLSSQFLIQVCV